MAKIFCFDLNKKFVIGLRRVQNEEIGVATMSWKVIPLLFLFGDSNELIYLFLTEHFNHGKVRLVTVLP